MRTWKSWGIAYAVVATTLLVSVSVALASTARDQWVPTSGRVITGDLGSNSRYVYQELQWRNDMAKRAFSIDSSYEHEILFYAIDGTVPYATELKSGGAFNCSLVSCYADTNLLDEIGFYGTKDEKSVGFGSYDPDTVTYGKIYTAYMETDKTSAYSGMYKINAQLGIVKARNPLAVNSLETDILEPYSSAYWAPWESTWRTEWEANNSRSYADGLNLSQWGTGWLTSTSDEDYWLIIPPTSRNYRIVAKVKQLKEMDYDIDILNSSGTRIALSHNNSGYDESVDVSLQANSSYYIRIYSYSGSSSTQSYSVVYNGI